MTSTIDSRLRLLVTIGASSMAVFATQLDLRAVQAAIPSMAADLGSTSSGLQWVMSGFMLVLASLLVVGGRLGDLFGRRRLLIVGCLLFASGSFIAGTSNAGEALVLGRVVQGAGGAIMFPTALAVTTNAVAPAMVSRAVSVVLAFGALGATAGLLVGGVLAESMSWRAVLLINVPMAAVVVVAALGVNESRDSGAPRSLDWPGVTLLAGSIGALMLATDLATDLSWLDPRVVLLACLGIGGLGLLVIVERRVASPLLDLRLFSNRSYTAVSVGGSLGVTTTTLTLFFATIYLQEVEGLTAVQAGLVFLTFSAASALAAVLSGRFGSHRPWHVMSAALIMGGAGTVGMFAIGELALFVILGLVAGFGLGLAFNYLNVVSQAFVPRGMAGAASGVAITMLVLAAAFALAVAVSVFDLARAHSGLDDGLIIRAILVAAGVTSIMCAGLVAAIGRRTVTLEGP